MLFNFSAAKGNYSVPSLFLERNYPEIYLLPFGQWVQAQISFCCHSKRRTYFLHVRVMFLVGERGGVC